MNYKYLNSASKIVCIGRNFAAHIKELNNTTPKQPFFFIKPRSSIITPFDKTIPEDQQLRISGNQSYNGLDLDGNNPGHILIPRGTTVHHEVEIALVIDKYISNMTVDNFKADDVYSSISGIALAFDLTARNVQSEAKEKGLPWLIAKGCDTFLPISNFIPKETFIQDKDNIQDAFHLKCKVNGVLKQDAGSNLMLVPFHSIIQHISTMITLEPGDIILTGTPAGVGQLNPGDNIAGHLFYKDQELINMDFNCKERPGPYVYRKT